MKKIQYHPLSDYFPMLPESEFDQLKESIAAFGLLEPITLLDGMILDGRNRYEACQTIEVEPHFREYAPNKYEPLDFVVAANMRRRHLSPEQKAQIIIDIEGDPEPDYGGKRGQTSERQKQGSAPSFKELGRKAGVSRMTIQRVAEVQDRPKLQAKLRSGEISASAAVRERMREVADKAEIEPTWRGLYARAPIAKDYIHDLGRVQKWKSKLFDNKYGLSKIDPKAHTPMMIKRTEEAIADLRAIKRGLEELKDG